MKNAQKKILQSSYHLLGILLALVIMLSLSPAALAFSDTPVGGSRSDRGCSLMPRSDGNYDLVHIEGVYIRQQSGTPMDTRTLKVTTYSPTFQELSSRELPIELPEFAGVYSGKDYNFIAFGQENLQDLDSVEVLRVVKYSKDWTRLGAASLYGANTIGIVYQHGNRSFAEYGGMLYIHMGHAIFKRSDGLNHQTNMTVCIRQSDMTITEKLDDVESASLGYVSHSLAQDILADADGNLVTLDAGDGYPRGASLFRYQKKAGGDTIISGGGSSILLTQWPGTTDISIGATTCALAETEAGYLSAYIDSGLGDSYNGTQPRSLYVAFTDKDNFSQSGTTVRKIFTGTPQESANYAYIVPISSDGGYLMWYTLKSYQGAYSVAGGLQIYYATYSSDGSVGAATPLNDVPWPDVGPIYVDGKLIWAESIEPVDGGGFKFCVMDSSGVHVYDGSGASTDEPVTPSKPDTAEKPSTQGQYTADLMLAAPTFGYTKAVKTDGSLWGWGDARDNLGHADVHPADGSLPYLSKPTEIAKGYIAAGINWGIKEDHSLWMWGLDIEINGFTDDYQWLTTPVKVMDNVQNFQSSLDMGYDMALKTDGTLWGWGFRNGFMNDGSGSDKWQSPSNAFKLMDNVKQFYLSCPKGRVTWMALKDDGTLWASGYSEYADLTANISKKCSEEIPLTRIMDGVKAFTAGWNSTFIIKEDGSLWSWGNNGYGQLGNGGKYTDVAPDEMIYQTEPVKILDDVIYASVSSTSYAVTSDGTLYGWGLNDEQQLGFSGGNFKSIPKSYETESKPCQSTPVKLMSDAVAVDGDYVLKKDGTLWENKDGKFVQILSGVALPTGPKASPKPSSSQTPSTSSTPSSPSAFSDIAAGKWYSDAVFDMAERGVVNGVGGGNFDPNGVVSQGQYFAMMARLFYSDQLSKEKGNWMTSGMEVARKNDLIAGTKAANAYSNGSWNSNILNGACSRYDLAQITYNYLVSIGAVPDPSEIEAAKDSISDYSSIPSAYRTAVCAVVAAGYMNGVGGGRFSGDGTLTRAQAVTLLYRLTQNLGV